jgi:molybdopterin converting factor small subunit
MYDPSIDTLRALVKKRARREVRGAMSDAADIILAAYVKQVVGEFNAAVQEGRAMEFVPRSPTPRELVKVAAALLTEGDGG